MAVVAPGIRREQQEQVARAVVHFLRARARLDRLITASGGQERVPFDQINDFVEGELFTLKEECHALFRATDEPDDEEHLTAGDLFDLVVGALFHQMMKVKENTYQLERYGPRYASLRRAMRGPDAPEHGEAFLKEGERIIQRSRRALRQDFKHAIELFHEATIVLRHLLREYRDNPLLVRLLLRHQGDVEAVYGHRSLDDLLSEIYDGGVAEALLIAATDLLHGGWYDEARDYCQRVLQNDPGNRHATQLLTRINAAATPDLTE